MKVLVACEESQEVCKAFREKGHEAYSCDIINCSGGHPQWHIMDDVLKILTGGKFKTMDGRSHCISNWDMIIAFPQWFADAWKLPAEERARVRSKTFLGIAKAMAEQWG